MFTGIITDIGSVRSVRKSGDLRIEIETSYDISTIDLGASIACNGVCLTVVEKTEKCFSVDVSAESVSLTNASIWSTGSLLNLDRALKVGDELGGHIVAGHVDGMVEIIEVSR